MKSFYKIDCYNVGDLLEILQNVPKSYEVKVYVDNFEPHFGFVNDIDIDHDEKRFICCKWKILLGVILRPKIFRLMKSKYNN